MKIRTDSRLFRYALSMSGSKDWRPKNGCEFLEALFWTTLFWVLLITIFVGMAVAAPWVIWGLSALLANFLFDLGVDPKLIKDTSISFSEFLLILPYQVGLFVAAAAFVMAFGWLCRQIEFESHDEAET